MYRRGGWIGAVCTFWYECPSVVLVSESLHVRTVCIWRCEHARFCVEVFYALYINFHSFILSLINQRYCPGKHLLKFRTFTVTLTLNTAKQPFHKTFQLMNMHCQTKLVAKKSAVQNT